MAYPQCPECEKKIKIAKVNRKTIADHTYHSCYKCKSIFAVTPA